MFGPPRRQDVLGVEITPITAHDLRQIISSAISPAGPTIVGHHNLHSVYLFQRDENMRRFFARATWVYIDGMPIVWAGRLRGHAFRSEHRITSVDVLPQVLDDAVRGGWRVFYLGSTDESIAKGRSALSKRWPRLVFDGAGGYFDVAGFENEDRIAAINAFKPHLLLVGMGMPRQEQWVLSNAERIEANVIWTVGACLDYFTGVIPTPPRWLGRVGLEWAYRLASEPRRLWRRYLWEPWWALALLPRDLMKRFRATSSVDDQ